MLKVRLSKTFAVFNHLPRRYCGINTTFVPRTYAGEKTEDTIVMGSIHEIVRALYDYGHEYGKCSVIKGCELGAEVLAQHESMVRVKVEILEGQLDLIQNKDLVNMLMRHL